MMMLVLLRVAALLLLSLASTTAQEALEEDLTALCEVKIARDRIPGLSCAAFVGDRIVYARGFGLSDVENDVLATTETVCRLASISKPLTAVLVMQLVEEGALDLDQDLHGLVPEWPKKRWPVTTRQLLGHLGGVRHYQGEGESTRRYANQRAGLLRFAQDPLRHQPGTRYLYSTYGFNLAAAAVETLREQPFAEVLAARIAKPAAAGSLQDDDAWRIIRHRSQGYVRRMGKLQNSQLMDSSYKLGGGGLCSSAPDLARVAQALLAGKLIQREARERLWKEQRTKAGEGTGYGLGFSLSTLDGERQVGHSGAQSRVSTNLQMLPDRGVGVVVLCNLQGVKLGGLMRRLLRRLRQELPR